MSLSLLTLLIVAVICLLLGGIVGMLVSAAGGPQEEEGEASESEAPPGGRKGRYHRLACLWREKNSGALLVEVDGKSYLGPAPLEGEARERVAAAASEFAQWIGVSPPAPGAAVPPARVVVERPQPAPPSAPAAAAKAQSKSMVDQINEVLDEMIAGTAYQAGGLSLVEDPLRGVVVWVGSTSYEGIDRVSDPEAQRLIRAAVAEWERRDEAARRQRLAGAV